MKTFLCSLLLAAGLLMAASTTEAQAQCTWTFISHIDCQINFRLYLTCPPNGPVPISTLNVSNAGCWDTPANKLFTVTLCNPPMGCTYSVQLNGFFYTNGSIFCCDPNVPPENCSSCNCAYVTIDPVTRTITLSPATSGPGWDCNDLQ